MKSKISFLSLMLIVVISNPVFAESNWVDEFLHRYNPATSSTTTTLAAGPFQTGAIPVTLNDVINLMLDHNLDIRSNRLSPRSSYYQSLVFYRALQPSIRFSGVVSRNSTLSNSQLNGAIPVNSQLRGNYSIGFSQQLPSGTSLTVDATMNRVSSTSNLNTFNPSYVSTITYSAGQHLLRDRGRKVTMRQIMIGENSEKISETQFETQITNLLAQVQKTYWDLVFAGEDLKVKQRSLDLAQRTLDENKMKVEIGTLAPIDVVQTQSEVASRRELLRSGLGGNALTEIPGGIGKALHQLFGYDYTGYSLGFSFVLPLSNKAQEADHSRALNERRLSQSKLEATAQSIALEVRNALTQVEMNRARIETAQTTRALAGQKLEAEQTKFTLGTSTLRFVLEEQRNVAQAETNELQSIVNFTKSLVDLDKAMGMTLRKNNIEIDKALSVTAEN